MIDGEVAAMGLNVEVRLDRLLLSRVEQETRLVVYEGVAEPDFVVLAEVVDLVGVFERVGGFGCFFVDVVDLDQS